MNKSTFHYGLFIERELVSSLTFVKKDYCYDKNLHAYQLRGMVTRSKYQNNKFGGRLLLESIKDLRKFTNTTIIWCNARDNTYDFYYKNYFRRKGGYFYINSIGLHYSMFFDCRHFKKEI